MATITDNLNTIVGIKEDIRNAITDKGVDMVDVPFSEFPDKIATIETGGGEKLKVGESEISFGYSRFTEVPDGYFDFSDVTYGAGLFDTCRYLEKIPQDLDLTKIHDGNRMFAFCNNFLLETLANDDNVIYFPELTHGYNMFAEFDTNYNWTGYVLYIRIEMPKAENLTYLFWNAFRPTLVKYALDIYAPKCSSFFDAFHNLAGLELELEAGEEGQEITFTNVFINVDNEINITINSPATWRFSNIGSIHRTTTRINIYNMDNAFIDGRILEDGNVRYLRLGGYKNSDIDISNTNIGVYNDDNINGFSYLINYLGTPDETRNIYFNPSAEANVTDDIINAALAKNWVLSF